jgi:hypothetical protein
MDVEQQQEVIKDVAAMVFVGKLLSTPSQTNLMMLRRTKLDMHQQKCSCLVTSRCDTYLAVTL